MKSFDAFARPVQEFQVKTTCGGCLSFCSLCLMASLFVQELRYFLELESKDEMVVDQNQDQKYFNISLDMTFPEAPCSVLSMNLMDTKKNNVLHVVHEIYKTRLSPEGQVLGTKVRDSLLNVAQSPMEVPLGIEPGVHASHATPHLRCPSCFQSHIDEDDCCLECADVQKEFKGRGWDEQPADYVFGQCAADAYRQAPAREREGCRLEAQLHVRKVPATLHISINRNFDQDLLAVKGPAQTRVEWLHALDFSHTIGNLAFGPDFPGLVYVLNGRDKLNHTAGTSDYYVYDVHLIPTRYEEDGEEPVASHQYSVTEYRRTVDPSLKHEDTSSIGLWINYDFTPFEVKVTRSRKNLFHFLTECCAILGGIFAFTSMLDKFAYSIDKALFGNRTGRTPMMEPDR